MLLLACVGIAFVVAKQGETVDRQRELIQMLDYDSRQLFESRMRDMMERRGRSKSEDPKKTDKAPNTPAKPDAPDSIPEPNAGKEPVTPGPRLVRI